MPDSLSFTVTGTKDDPAPLDLDSVDTVSAKLVQALVDAGYDRSTVTIKAEGHDDIEGPERTGDDFDPVVPS